MNDWHLCISCESEFRVVSETLEQPAFCPYCGTEIEEEEEEDEDLDYWGIED